MLERKKTVKTLNLDRLKFRNKYVNTLNLDNFKV